MTALLKYCGNHSFEDIVVTSNSQADYLGFVFAPSKRCVSAEEVANWLGELTVTQKLVGVFVNASLQEIEDVIKHVPLDVIQCHGDETPEFITNIKTHLNKIVWKVIHHSDLGLKTMKKYSGLVDGFVIDSKAANARGGTGVTFDWDAIPSYQREALAQNVPCFIAGGVNVNTIETLLDYEPIGIDLSSGIEEQGQKSAELRNQFEARLCI